jgi:VNT family MFS transporter (synaptic vesicle glycoprotein 2)
MTLDFLDDTQVEYEQAVSQTKFGKFHFFLLAVCGLIYLNTAVGITIISFVLPSATCGEQFLLIFAIEFHILNESMYELLF